MIPDQRPDNPFAIPRGEFSYIEGLKGFSCLLLCWIDQPKASRFKSLPVFFGVFVSFPQSPVP